MARRKAGKSKSRKGKARKHVTRKGGGVGVLLDKIVTPID